MDLSDTRAGIARCRMEDVGVLYMPSTIALNWLAIDSIRVAILLEEEHLLDVLQVCKLRLHPSCCPEESDESMLAS